MSGWRLQAAEKRFDQTPYLLEEIKCRQNTSLKSECADIPPAQMELNLENADISRQSRVEESKVEENRKKKDEDLVLSPPPEYALNTKTHNYGGLLLALEQIKIIDIGEKKRFYECPIMEKSVRPYGKYWHKLRGIKSECPENIL